MCSATVTDAVRPGPSAHPRPDPAGPETGTGATTEIGTENGTGATTEIRAQDSEGHAVWRHYLRGHATVTRALEAELLARQELSLAAFDVLAELAQAPERRMRMTELADAVLLSRSGVTRMVDRLERLGLVTRGRVEEDGRGIAATLTDQGQEQLDRASVTHVAAVQRHFVNRLDETDLRDLRRISRRLTAGAAAEPAATSAELTALSPRHD
jgi:DNA-binding MarR family transcriptional regulator